MDKISQIGPDFGLTVSKTAPFGITIDSRYKGGAVSLVCFSDD